MDALFKSESVEKAANLLHRINWAIFLKRQNKLVKILFIMTGLEFAPQA